MSIEMIRSGIFITCDLWHHGECPCPGKIKQLAPGETGQSLQTFQFEAWHLQPKKTWTIRFVLFHCTAVWCFISVSFACTTWELVELVLSQHVEPWFYCPPQLCRSWTCVQTLEWQPLLTGVYSKPGSNLWVQRSWTLRTGQVAMWSFGLSNGWGVELWTLISCNCRW